MPVTNGNEIAVLLEEATEKNPGLTETAIAERTAELGAPFGEVSARTLGRAKSNANIKKGNLLSLAEIFSQLLDREVSYESLVADAVLLGAEEDSSAETEVESPEDGGSMSGHAEERSIVVNAKSGAQVNISQNNTTKD